MALPSALKDRIARRRRAHGSASKSESPHTDDDVGEHQTTSSPSNGQVRRSTKLRRVSVIVASCCFFLSFIFNLMVVIGNLNKNTLTSVYFYKLDLANIVPTSVPNANLINSIARTIGLHDFYQVGLWGFCEGYVNEGVTDCSKPQSLYWFNPVAVLMNELLRGATIALPSEVITILDVLRIASHVMFGCFITVLVLSALLIFVGPLALYSHWSSVPVGIAAFCCSALLLSAAAIATVMSVAFKYAASSQQDLNISAEIGVDMFVFMWLSVGFNLLAFILHAGLCCCCRSVRDVKSGRKSILAAKLRGGTVGGSSSGEKVREAPEQPMRLGPTAETTGGG